MKLKLKFQEVGCCRLYKVSVAAGIWYVAVQQVLDYCGQRMAELKVGNDLWLGPTVVI